MNGGRERALGVQERQNWPPSSAIPQAPLLRGPVFCSPDLGRFRGCWSTVVGIVVFGDFFLVFRFFLNKVFF